MAKCRKTTFAIPDIPNAPRQEVIVGKFSVIRNTDALKTAESLTAEGERLGIDVTRLREKIKSVRSLVEGAASIVFLGDSVDGKANAISGLAGDVLGGGNIDANESTDELSVYKIAGRDAGFVVADIVVCSGAKEREVDDKKTLFSEATEGRISDAQVVVCVCDAGTSLRKGCVPVVKKVLRDFGKLDSAVFVLNVAGDAGRGPFDEDDFRRRSEIRKKKLIKSLKNAIGLTAEEKRKLRIVCIASDPGNKGVCYWLADDRRCADYEKRSRIGDFRKAVQAVVDETDTGKICASDRYAVLTDMLRRLQRSIEEACNSRRIILAKSEKLREKLADEATTWKYDFEKIRICLEKKLQQEERELIARIGTATPESYRDILIRDIGMNVEKGWLFFSDKESLTCDRLLGKIQRAVSGAEGEIGEFGERVGENFIRNLLCLTEMMRGDAEDDRRQLELPAGTEVPDDTAERTTMVVSPSSYGSESLTGTNAL